MTEQEHWDEFINKEVVTNLKLQGRARDFFVARFSWKNRHLSETEFIDWLKSNEVRDLHNEIYSPEYPNEGKDGKDKYVKQKTNIFKNATANGGNGLSKQFSENPKNKVSVLSNWLKNEYEQWKIKFPITTYQQSSHNWHEVCYTKLELWRKRIIDLVIGGNRLNFDNIDRTFVPLDFLEKVKKESSQSKNADQLGNQQTEEYKSTQRYERQQDFLDVIIRSGLSEGIAKKQGQRLAIIGETGSGKTTLLLQIGYELLKQPNNLVIWISLKEVRDKQKSIWDYILEEWFKGSNTDKNEWEQEFNNKLKDGYVWLLLDGLEDISDRAYSIIGQFDDWRSKPKIALTCRKNRWDSDKADFASFDYGIYECIGYNSEQPSNFIDAWFSDDLESASLLKSELQQATRHRINDLIKYPLHLSLLCSIYEKSESNFAFAATKAELFDQFIKKQYKRKITKDRFDADLVKSLGELAIKAIDTQTQLTYVEVKENLGDRLEKALELGWLKSIDEYEQVYDFLHDSFKEYFAALAISHWKFFLPNSLDNFKGNDYPIFDKQWREVILFWFGRKGFEEDKEDFIEALINFEDGCCDSSIVNGKSFYGYRAYFLAASCLSEFKICSRDQAIVKQIIEWGFGALNTENEMLMALEPISEGSRSILLHTNPCLASKYLRQILSNPRDEKLRLYLAAKNLAKIAIDSDSKDIAVNIFIDLIKDSTDKEIQQEAIFSLEKVITNSESKDLAIKVLTHIIKDSNDRDIIFSAAASLGKITTDCKNKEIAVSTLVDLIESTTDGNLISMSAYSLWSISTDSKNKEIAISTLLSLINNSSTNANTLCHAVYLLTKTSADSDYKNLTIKSLIRIIEDPSIDVDILYLAGKILMRIDATSNSKDLITNKLIQLIKSPNTDEQTRCKLLIRLGEITNNNEENAELIRRMISSKIQIIRIQAAIYLKNTLKEVSLQTWSSILISLRNYLYKSLGNIKNPYESNEEYLFESYAYYESIWHCAQNMRYPEFYRAWHSSNRSNNSKLKNTTSSINIK